MNLSVLKELRKGKRIKQKDLAKNINIKQSYLSLIESNKRNPSIELIENICIELDCELRIIPKS